MYVMPLKSTTPLTLETFSSEETIAISISYLLKFIAFAGGHNAAYNIFALPLPPPASVAPLT